MHGLKRGLLLSTVVGLSLTLGCATKPQTEAAPTSPNSEAKASQSQGPTGQTPTNAAGAAPKAPKGPRTRTDSPPKPDISCAKAGDTRALEIEEVHSGCWLFYVNRGIKKRIAWSKKGNGHCEKVRDQIRVSLEKGGYTCKWDE